MSFLHVSDEVIYLLNTLGKNCEGGEHINTHGKQSGRLQNRVARVLKET
jgi:hypothetical protein